MLLVRPAGHQKNGIFSQSCRGSSTGRHTLAMKVRRRMQPWSYKTWTVE